MLQWKVINKLICTNNKGAMSWRLSRVMVKILLNLYLGTSLMHELLLARQRDNIKETFRGRTSHSQTLPILSETRGKKLKMSACLWSSVAKHSNSALEKPFLINKLEHIFQASVRCRLVVFDFKVSV